MLAAAPLIQARLTALPALAGWAVRNELDVEDRKELPAATVACIGATVETGQRKGMLQPRWQITLATRRDAGALTALDAALEAVIASLHGWLPPQDANGRRWEPLAIASVLPPEYPEAGISAYVITFTTAGLYRGQE